MITSICPSCLERVTHTLPVESEGCAEFVVYFITNITRVCHVTAHLAEVKYSSIHFTGKHKCYLLRTIQPESKQQALPEPICGFVVPDYKWQVLFLSSL